MTTEADLPDGVMPVVLAGGEEASGLAEMLQQFLEQTLAESPRKIRQATRLRGGAVFRSAEDAEVCVRIGFCGDRIELRDGAATESRDPSITADFLSIAHLTAGTQSPLRLLLQRRLDVRFSPAQVPFLLGVLWFMRIESASHQTKLRWLWPGAAAIAALAGLYWYFSATR